MDVATLIRRAQQAKTARLTFDSQWQEVADRVLPSREFTRKSAAGSKRNALIFNTVPVLACEQLAGGWHGMLTSSVLRWFRLVPVDWRWRNDPTARAYFDLATDRLFEHFTSPAMGFSTGLHENYLDLSAFGNASLFMPDLGLRGCGYQALPLAESYWSMDGDGSVGAFFRMWQEKLGSLVRQWGKLNTIPKDLLEKAAKQPEETVEMIHAVYPLDGKKKSWEGKYILKEKSVEIENQSFGDDGFPFAIARLIKRSGEDYGSGPGMHALPDVKLLNELERIGLRGAAKALDPPIALPDDGFLTPVSNLGPGAIVYKRNDYGARNQIEQFPVGDPRITDAKISQVEGRVKSTFYADWMTLPSQPNMTATEVLQRRDEMLRLLGPMVSRLETELLGPIIERSLRVLIRNGLIPAPPPELSGAVYHVEYLGPLSTAQRTQDAEAVLRWLQSIAQLAQVDPNASDVVKAQETADYLADRFGVPARLVASAEDVAAKQQQRQQAAAAQQGAQNVATMAKGAKDGSGALSQIMGMMNGGGAPAAANDAGSGAAAA